MRMDVLALLVVVLLVVLDYALTGGFYLGKITELVSNVFYGISRRF